MKKITFALAAACTVALSCNQTSLDPAAPAEFTVSAEQATVKSTLSGLDITFEAGDKFILTDLEGSAVYKAEAAGKTVKLAYVSGDKLGSGVCAFYPAEYDSATVVTLPETVSGYTPGDLDAPLFGRASGTTIPMKLCAGAVAVRLKGEGSVTSVSLSSDCQLAGQFSCDVEDGGVLKDGAEDSKTSVKLVCASPIALSAETAADFYFNVPAGAYTGVKVTVELEGGVTRTCSLKQDTVSVARAEITDFDITLPSVSAKTYWKLDLSQVNLATAFDSSFVLKAVDAQGAQKAELAKEYLRLDGTVDKRGIVAYPMLASGKADITKGIDVENGGSVAFSLSGTTTTLTYTAGAAAVSALYVDEDGALSTTCSAATTEPLTLVAYVLKETRKASEGERIYRIVKIGAQYWMADNLRTIYGLYNGTTYYKMNSSASYNYFGCGGYAYGKDEFLSEDKTQILYDGEVAQDNFYYGNPDATTPKCLAIESDGWDVPENTQFTALKNYIGSSSNPGEKLKDASYSTVTSSEVTNITGFSAKGCGYYSSTTTWDDTKIYYWTKSNGTGSNLLKVYACILKPGAATMSLSTANPGSTGAYIRFIRK